MADYNHSFSRTMGTEGGWVNNPDDSGKETYRGVARAHWGTWKGWLIIDKVKATLPNQPLFGTAHYYRYAKQLNTKLKASDTLQELIKEFYLKNFWGSLGLIADQRVADECFDKAVNCGAVAYRWVQRAVGVTDDGVIGKMTAAKVNKSDPKVVVADFNRQAKVYYDGIVAHNPKKKQFYKSWMGRLRTYEDTPYKG